MLIGRETNWAIPRLGALSALRCTAKARGRWAKKLGAVATCKPEATPAEKLQLGQAFQGHKATWPWPPNEAGTSTQAQAS